MSSEFDYGEDGQLCTSQDSEAIRRVDSNVLCNVVKGHIDLEDLAIFCTTYLHFFLVIPNEVSASCSDSRLSKYARVLIVIQDIFKLIDDEQMAMRDTR
jgi:hypothetical protein